MSKYRYITIINDSGFLTDKGKELVAEKFQASIKELLTMTDTENEARILGSVLSNALGKTISNHIQASNEILTSFFKMTDEEFEEHLQKIYGKNWFKSPLTAEEAKRYNVIATKQMEKMLAKSATKMDEFLLVGAGLIEDRGGKVDPFDFDLFAKDKKE